MSKEQLRKRYRENRRHLSYDYRLKAAKSAVDIFLQSALFKQNENFACYLPVNYEFDTTKMIEALWQANKKCYLPIAPDQSLIFVKYEQGDALQLNRYGIFEPMQLARQIAVEDLDIVLMPLVAFDNTGNRLGMGGGFYDRTFAFVKEAAKKPIKRPILIGLAYAAQEVSQLPKDPWDVALDGVLTEKEFIFFTSSTS